ncbi:hypothetical protein [Shewanella xiamenensis]|uniref:hypothetical protein n=1 Tax=Shewanella xiamenensis TaxID=332186 RepID=UPI0021C1A7C3|nr:hypothetical protein [Shewanella xiamenensis]MCT8863442.1 hypothetical protein [Shewanella xiamenensis]
MENNIEKFNYYVGTIFGTLYSSFPCRENIEYLKIINCEECPETWEHGIYTGIYVKDGTKQYLANEINFLHETLNWLYETEYLIGSVGLSASGKYATVTLSPKALEILKVIPESIDEIISGKSIGDELSDALGSAAKEKVIDLAKKALSYLFTIGWGSLNITG